MKFETKAFSMVLNMILKLILPYDPLPTGRGVPSLATVGRRNSSAIACEARVSVWKQN